MLRWKKSRFPDLPRGTRVSSPWRPRRDYADVRQSSAGQGRYRLYIVESGQIEIRNPTDRPAVIVVHEPGQFSGDIDLLTGAR